MPPLTDLVHNQLLDAAQMAIKTEIIGAHCAYSHCKKPANFVFHLVSSQGKHSLDFLCLKHINHVLKKGQEREEKNFFLPGQVRPNHVVHQSRFYLN